MLLGDRVVRSAIADAGVRLVEVVQLHFGVRQSLVEAADGLDIGLELGLRLGPIECRVLLDDRVTAALNITGGDVKNERASTDQGAEHEHGDNDNRRPLEAEPASTASKTLGVLAVVPLVARTVSTHSGGFLTCSVSLVGGGT